MESCPQVLPLSDGAEDANNGSASGGAGSLSAAFHDAWKAAQDGDLKALQEIVEKPNFPAKPELVQIAAAYNRKEICTYLLVDRGWSGGDAYAYAERAGHQQLCHHLLSLGCPVTNLPDAVVASPGQPCQSSAKVGNNETSAKLEQPAPAKKGLAGVSRLLEEHRLFPRNMYPTAPRAAAGRENVRTRFSPVAAASHQGSVHITANVVYAAGAAAAAVMMNIELLSGQNGGFEGRF